MPEPKLLLCADLHLGRASAWLGGPAEVDRSAVGAWRRIVDYALAGQATAVVIGGDVFDGKEAYYETRQAFRDGLLRLKGAGIPTIAVAGNHDWFALPAFARQFPDDLIVLGVGGRWESRSIDGITYAGWSFPSGTHTDRAFDTFARPQTAEPVVGLVHGDTVAGSQYHPLTTRDLSEGADAWVLGHIHLHQRVGRIAVYPGSPQALDFGPGEMGAHGFVWLTFEAGRPQFSPLVPISTVWFQDWQSDQIRVEDGEDPAEALERATQDYCQALLRSQPTVESVQLRVRALLSNCRRKPATLPSSPDERYFWQFVDVWARDDRDPWADAFGADAAAEVARLLIGTLAEDGMYDSRPVDPDWLAAADTLVQRAVGDVDNYWRKTVGNATDHFGESVSSPPDPHTAMGISKQLVAGELWEMLRNIEVAE